MKPSYKELEPTPLSITTNISDFKIFGYRVGKLCIISLFGKGASFSQAWTDYVLGKINDITAKEYASSVFTNQVGQIGDITIEKNSNELKLNYEGVTPTPENSWIRGQIVFVCN